MESLSPIAAGALGSLAAGMMTAVGAAPMLFVKRPGQQTQSVLLGFAAGVMLAASFFSLIIPGVDVLQAGGASQGWAAGTMAAAVLIGATVIGLMNRFAPVDMLAIGPAQSKHLARRIWLFIIAITLHNFPEGAAVGVSFGGGDMHQGLATALGIGIQNMPEGLAVSAAMASLGYGRGAAFLAAHWPVLLLLVAAYVMLTAFRDLRDNFAAEIWQALGYGDAASVFTASEGPVAALSLVAMGVLIAVKNNGRALLFMHGVILAGFAILGASTLAFQQGLLSPIVWMIAGGAGLYLAYTPFNAMLFDRMIAYSGTVATAGFLIYVADSTGYLGSVALLLFKNFGAVDLPWLPFFVGAAYATSLAGLILVGGAAILFLRGRGDGSPSPKGSEGQERP